MNELINQVHCMDFEALCDAIEPQSIDLIATDMPYGTTACTWDKRVDFDILWRCVKRVLKPRGVFLTTASEPFASLLRVSNLDWYKYDWVWVKSRSTGFLDANRKPLSNYENVLVFYDKQPDFNPQKTIGKPNHVSLGSKSAGKKTALYGGYVPQISKYTIDKYPNKVIEFNSIDPTQSIHPTQKPTTLYEYLIRTYTQPGDLVLDPFCGSGTTGLAALRTGRRYILGDSDAGYVEAARQRIQTADPMQDSILADGVTQLSLFS